MRRMEIHLTCCSSISREMHQEQVSRHLKSGTTSMALIKYGFKWNIEQSLICAPNFLTATLSERQAINREISCFLLNYTTLRTFNNTVYFILRKISDWKWINKKILIISIRILIISTRIVINLSRNFWFVHFQSEIFAYAIRLFF